MEPQYSIDKYSIDKYSIDTPSTSVDSRDSFDYQSVFDSFNRLALSGEIPVVMCGRKRLINLDALIDYLSSADNAAAVSPISDGIRRIV